MFAAAKNDNVFSKKVHKYRCCFAYGLEALKNFEKINKKTL